MSAETFLTEFGLPGIHLVPYGLHTCFFYDDDEHLEVALAQYFSAGVRNRERCIWITAEPFDTARRAPHWALKDSTFARSSEAAP